MGNMYRLSKMLVERLSVRDAKIVLLANTDIKYCTGCLKCEDEGLCPINDMMGNIRNDMVSAETIIFATPVYFDNLPGKLKTLIDRSNLFMSDLAGKKCFAFLCGQADAQSWENCAKIIENYAGICKMDYLGYVAVQARDIEDLNDTQINDMFSTIFKLLGE